ncbi:MAG: hypothetical protein HY290_19670, partial [Planctomycetia bacterium]|nr:hypothetical protein [Planctomycetia bacterium]
MPQATWILAAPLPGDWLQHAPDGAVPAALVGVVLVAILVVVLPRPQRRRALQPAAFLLISALVLFLEESVGNELKKAVSSIALFFSFAAVARSVFLLAVFLLQRVFQFNYQKI